MRVKMPDAAALDLIREQLTEQREWTLQELAYVADIVRLTTVRGQWRSIPEPMNDVRLPSARPSPEVA